MITQHRVGGAMKPVQRSLTVHNQRIFVSLLGLRLRLLLGLLLVCPRALPAIAWEHWGGDQGGTRFSTLSQITPLNVDNLVGAWGFHTGDMQSRPPAAMARTKFEATPLFVADSLILCSPFNEVI